MNTSPTKRKLRLGIDVGGTFTDVVAIDAASHEVVARLKTPTTHEAAEGVAAGIIAGIAGLVEQKAFDPAEVAFIAHATTQATNALLEGDVAAVGVLGLLDGVAPVARSHIRFAPVLLAPQIRFTPRFAFASRAHSEQTVRALEQLRSAGTQAIAVSSAFSVDRPEAEIQAAERARELGLFATAGHEVSSLYGLRARTRTAAINAAILPTMVRTARMTDDAVGRARIASPLMIMRSDGGVMDAREMERRPILTLLSGPAAGVAGALLHENVTDGIFVEVGGTSSDCSAIRAGMPQMRPARVGGQRMMLRTLDVRTLGIAGGSMVRCNQGSIVDVGPRSAHIAGCRYASFVDPQTFEGTSVQFIGGQQNEGYAVIVPRNGSRVALTPTCAANLLGYVGESDFARGNLESVERAFALFARELGGDARSLATRVLDIASSKLLEAIEELIADYEMDRHTVALVGGGGGAAALVPYAGRHAGLAYRLARDADVISPIGVALALVREVVERTIVDPSPEDIVRIRRQAQDAVVAAGASPERVEVAIEIDAQRNRVRATASGASELAGGAARASLSDEALQLAAAELLRAPAQEVFQVAATDGLTIFERQRSLKRRYGMQMTRDLRVLDRNGVARLALRDARVRTACGRNAIDTVTEAMENDTAFGDVGRAPPQLFVLHGSRVADFSGLSGAEQAVALAREELAGRAADAPVVVLTVARPA